MKDFRCTFKLDGLGYSCCIESHGLDNTVIDGISFNMIRDVLPYLIRHDFDPSSFIMKASDDPSKNPFVFKAKDKTLRFAYGIFKGREDQGEDLWYFYHLREYKWLSTQLSSLLRREDIGILEHLECYGLNLHTFRMEVKRNDTEQRLFL